MSVNEIPQGNALSYVKALAQEKRYDMRDLLCIMQILRGENGCPWDKVQTHQSIRMNFVEEVYEALEAIDRNDTALLKEELGDVLLQVVFHAAMEQEIGNFDFSDVVHDVCKKLIIRHPHIFSDADAVNASDALINWNEMKRKTKGQQTYTETLEAVSKALPGLMRAQKLHSRTEKAGVCPESDESVRNRIVGYATALANAVSEEEKQHLIGKLLFETTLLTHQCDIEAEQLLEREADAYIKRFANAEAYAATLNVEIKDCDQTMIQHLIHEEGC